MVWNFWIAYWLILFGCIKAIVGTISLSVPQTRPYFEKVPVANIFVNNDVSIAGFYSEVGIILFGGYSLLHGLAILKQLPPILNTFLETRASFILFYSLFAIAFIGFYGLVLFSPLPIPKNSQYIANYWLNIAAGLFFILMINILFIWNEWKSSNSSYSRLTLWILLMILLIYSILKIVFYAYDLENKPKPHDLIAYLTIPLNLA
jgi:hypothetical protein